MKINDVFPTRFVASADLNGKAFTLMIKSVTLEDMQSHKNQEVTKPVVWFANASKGLVLNATNARIIASLYGNETDDWEGKQITIYATRVKAFGSYQDAIRVKEEIPAVSRPIAKAKDIAATSEIDDLDEVADFEAHAGGYDDGMWEPQP